MMITDTRFNSLTRALALSSEAASKEKRLTISVVASAGRPNEREHFITTARDDGIIKPHYELRLKAQQLDTMTRAFESASIHQHYLNRVVYQPLSVCGLAIRVQEAFGHGYLYTRQGTDLIFVPDPSIPSNQVAEVLQATALDRVVVEAIYTESEFAARRHTSGRLTTPELRHIPITCTTSDVRTAYLGILRSILQDPDYRNRVGADLSEIF